MATVECLPLVGIAARDQELEERLPLGLGIRAATYTIRDETDNFMNDIAEQGKWASWAALAAGVSVVLQALDRLLQ